MYDRYCPWLSYRGIFASCHTWAGRLGSGTRKVFKYMLLAPLDGEAIADCNRSVGEYSTTIAKALNMRTAYDLLSRDVTEQTLNRAQDAYINALLYN